VRTSDVTDSRIIDAMLEVPREAFVPTTSRRWPISTSISMSAPRVSPKRYLIKPAVTAKAAAGGRDQAHRQGFGWSGAGVRLRGALAAKLAGQVTATESDPWLAARLAAFLTQIGCGNVHRQTRCGRRR